MRRWRQPPSYPLDGVNYGAVPASRWFVNASMPLCAMVFVPRSLAQMPERSPEEYIEKIFEARIGELPRMGWFVPLHGFVAHEDAAERVYLFAPIGTPSIGRKKELVSRSELKRLRKTYGLACEIEDTDHLTAFDVGSDIDPERALYTTKAMPGEAHAGLLTISLDGMQLRRVNRLLGWPNQGTLRRDDAIGVRAQSFFYSFHKLYNMETGLLRQEAIVLHGKDGIILAHELTRDLDSGQPCDGCGIPCYVYPESGLYKLLNMFELPGFAYPVILLDTSTVEGRALSLRTFRPDLKATQFRVYQYVVHCD